MQPSSFYTCASFLSVCSFSTCKDVEALANRLIVAWSSPGEALRGAVRRVLLSVFWSTQCSAPCSAIHHWHCGEKEARSTLTSPVHLQLHFYIHCKHFPQQWTPSKTIQSQVCFPNHTGGRIPPPELHTFAPQPHEKMHAVNESWSGTFELLCSPWEIKAALLREQPQNVIKLHIRVRNIPSRHVMQGWSAPRSPAAILPSRSVYKPCIHCILWCILNTASDLAWIRAVPLVRLLYLGLEQCRCIC